jgi:hypothetical protein
MREDKEGAGPAGRIPQSKEARRPAFLGPRAAGAAALSREGGRGPALEQTEAGGRRSSVVPPDGPTTPRPPRRHSEGGTGMLRVTFT